MKKLLLCLPARRSLGIGGSLSLLVRRSLIISVCFLILQILGEGGSLLHSQVPQLMKYQAVLRDANGDPIVSQSKSVGIIILQDSASGSPIFWETHKVTTTAQGLINLDIGSVKPFDFAAINWANGPYFLKITVDGVVMGTSQLLSVSYALYSNKTNTNAKFEVQGVSGLSSDSALFIVKDKLGRPVFAVYEDGAVVYVNEGAKGGRGGFAVGGRRPGKATVFEDIFRVTQDSVRIYINDTAVHKGGRGGFAVGGRKPGKGTINDYLQVTPDSTRIYINDTYAKGGRGGFAVGGRKPSKGPVNDYLRVTPDSTRVYVNEPAGKGGRGGFAVGGRKPTKGNPEEYFNISSNDSTDVTIINPSKPRIFWYPRKAAFLTGRVLVENPDSVGTNSMATGYESKAIGNWSQALGYKAIAKGDYSTAIGKNAIAKKINSFAFGEGANAVNDESYAIGRGAVASGYRSFAFGSAGIDSAGNVTDVARAIGDYSFAIGQGSQALGRGAFAIGIADTATGNYSVALGYKTSAKGYGATALGYKTKSSSYSTAMGYSTTATSYSTAMGYSTTASGFISTAMGIGTTATGIYSTSMGNWTTASGYNSTAMGNAATASGSSSTAMGNATKASGSSSTAMGYYTVAPSGYETAIGISNTVYTPVSTTSWSASDRLFVIGNGTSIYAPSDALIVYKNGNTYIKGRLGIGTPPSAYNLDVTGEISSRSMNAFRLRGTSYSTIIRNDGSDFYLLVTNSGDPDGSWNNFRPFRMNLANGYVHIADATLSIVPGGNVGIGTTTANYKLDVRGTIGNNTTLYHSDERWKTDIKPIKYGIAELKCLNGIRYSWKVNSYPEMGFDEGTQFGFIAQEFEKVIPELVRTDKDGYKSIDYVKLTPVLVEAFKEQQQQIESVIQENQQLKSELDEIKSLVTTIIANQTIKGNK